MSDRAISVTSLGKRYRLGHVQSYGMLRDALSGTARESAAAIRSFGRPRTITSHARRPTDHWALRDITFDVAQGEVLGIIGANGAGKSTLLKILSRITEPTTGRAVMHGRLGSLLETGSGFHPELSGRENVYLNGTILGMTRSEIRRKFDEIVAFAEVERFLDVPVKRYSSGMYARLAFAVAAHLEPDILIVDEVLSVGDAAFQQKSLGKMEDFAESGRTVLFVSHNMPAIQGLCRRAIWLEHGSIVADGPSTRIVANYLRQASSTRVQRSWPTVADAPGNDVVRIRRASIHPLGYPSSPMTIRTPLVLDFEYWNLQPGTRLSLSWELYNAQGILVFSAGAVDEPDWLGKPFPTGIFRDTCHVPGDLLNDGMYRVHLRLVKNQTEVLHEEQDILIFDIQDSAETRGEWYGEWPGVIRPTISWRTELLTPLHSTFFQQSEQA